MQYYAYLLRCADDTFYAGATNDIEKRLHAHNHAKKGAHYTKIRRPVTLVYKEEFKTLAEARAREASFKRMKREEKLLLMVTIDGHHRKLKGLKKRVG